VEVETLDDVDTELDVYVCVCEEMWNKAVIFTTHLPIEFYAISVYTSGNIH